MRREFIKIEGLEKGYYLKKLDTALDVLVKRLHSEDDDSHIGILKEISEKHNWDWSRLPKYSRISSTLADQVELIRKEYKLFDWITDEQHPYDNMGYFERIDVSTTSGLPSSFEQLNLKSLKKRAESLLSSMPDYTELNKQYTNLLMGDYASTTEVRGKLEAIRNEAFKRNYLENIDDRDLIGTATELECMLPSIKKIRNEIGETLWNVSFMKYSLASGIYQLYSIDLWQDIIAPQISEENGKVVLSRDFNSLMNSFSNKNDTAYILRTIDNAFESIHPVHVTRGILGPFESIFSYNTADYKKLPITEEILNEDKNFMLLRFNREYSYAPNHRTIENSTRQIMEQDVWSEDIIVCPTTYKSRVSRSILGTNVTILGM